MLTLGNFEIHLLHDGIVWADPGGAFGLIPRKLWSRYLKPNDDHLVPMVLCCPLLRANDQWILMDTGMGVDKLDERQMRIWQLARPHGSLFDGLARLGLSPADIDIVVNTHLHSDHCTGNTTPDGNGGFVPSFPNAVHIVQARELEDARHPNERTSGTYFAENFEPLAESGQLRVVDGAVDIAAGVRGVPTPGHTPGHMSVVMESAGEHGFFVCDMAGFAVQFQRLAWMSAYDVEPLVTLESKRIWQRWALDHDALLISCHDTQNTVFRLHEDSGEVAIQPVDAAFA